MLQYRMINWLHSGDLQASNMQCCLAYLLALYDCRLGNTFSRIHKHGSRPICPTMEWYRWSRVHLHTSATPTQLPPTLVRHITQQTPQWTLFPWRKTFSAFWKQEWQSPHRKHTMQAGRYTRNSWLNGLLPHTLSQGTRLTLLFMLMWKHRG